MTTFFLAYLFHNVLKSRFNSYIESILLDVVLLFDFFIKKSRNYAIILHLNFRAKNSHKIEFKEFTWKDYYLNFYLKNVEIKQHLNFRAKIHTKITISSIQLFEQHLNFTKLT